jgi:hypothetical protein
MTYNPRLAYIKRISSLPDDQKLRKGKVPCDECGAYLAGDTIGMVCSPCEERSGKNRIELSLAHAAEKARWR